MTASIVSSLIAVTGGDGLGIVFIFFGLLLTTSSVVLGVWALVERWYDRPLIDPGPQ